VIFSGTERITIRVNEIADRSLETGMALTSLQDRFCRLLEEHGRVVLKVANTYAFRHQDRQELVQEIHAQLWRSFASYDERRPFATWLYRVALNVSISHVRSESMRLERTVSLDPDSLDQVLGEAIAAPPADDELAERQEFLSRFIQGLGQLDRALMLLYLEEHTYQQISEILGISETNVATKVARIKQRVRLEAAKQEAEQR